MAGGVAGFVAEIELRGFSLEGTSPEVPEGKNYLHKGIGNRNFRRQFTLAEHIEVEDAELENGMLHINLVRNVPEAQKPKKISIREVGTIEG